MSGNARRLLLAAVAVLAIRDAGAVKVPDWVRRAAESAPAIPDGVPATQARVLLLETRLEIEPGGTWRVRHRRVVQALSARSDGVGTGTFALGGERKVRRSTAWHLPPGEKAERTREAIEVSLGDAFLTDDTARLIGFDGVRKGSVVAFEFEAETAPWTLTERLWLSDADGPVDLARAEIVHPPGWSVRTAWIGGEGPQAALVPGGALVEVRDLPALDLSPDVALAPDPLESARVLVLGFTPPAGGPVPLAPAFGSWSDVARWFDRIASGRSEPGPRVRATATEAGVAGRTWAEAVVATGEFVRDRVRYLAQNVGIGGYRPRAAEETARDLHGDCKDKTILFLAILETASLRAHGVLVNATTAGTVAREVPDPAAFDHMIAAVEVPDGTEVPPGWQGAVAAGGPTGRLLLVDPTQEYVAIGSLPGALSGRIGLLLLGETGELIDLPVHPPTMHRVERTLDLAPDPAGGWKGDERRVATGEFAARARATHRADPTERRRWREATLRRRWPAAVIEEYAVVDPTAAGGLEDRIRFHVTTPDGAGSVFGAWLDEVVKPGLRRRTIPVVFAEPFTVVIGGPIPGWPEGAASPADFAARGDGWSVEARFERKTGSLRGTLTATVARTRFEPDRFEELKLFFDAIATAQAATLTPAR